MRKATKVHEDDLPSLTRATFEVSTDLYLQFKRICAAQDLTFSQVLRRYMRETVAEREAA